MKGKQIVKTAAVILALLLMSGKVYADAPVKLYLEPEKQEMASGEKMNISVSLDGYDEEYTENVITTMIIEVSVDTTALKVEADSIEIEMDAGKGMAYTIGRMSDENNVELQYVNVENPLKKGTKTLYSFDVTALKDIKNLKDKIKITYALVQDGTLKTSEKINVEAAVNIKGRIEKQGNIDERYTSVYGMMFENETVKAQSETAATLTSVVFSEDILEIILKLGNGLLELKKL